MSIASLLAVTLLGCGQAPVPDAAPEPARLALLVVEATGEPAELRVSAESGCASPTILFEGVLDDERVVLDDEPGIDVCGSAIYRVESEDLTRELVLTAGMPRTHRLVFTSDASLVTTTVRLEP